MISIHEKIFYYCTQCDFKSTNEDHVKTIHKGYILQCYVKDHRKPKEKVTDKKFYQKRKSRKIQRRLENWKKRKK